MAEREDYPPPYTHATNTDVGPVAVRAGSTQSRRRSTEEQRERDGEPRSPSYRAEVQRRRQPGASQPANPPGSPIEGFVRSANDLMEYVRELEEEAEASKRRIASLKVQVAVEQATLALVRKRIKPAFWRLSRLL